jgi:hypothetical protein
MLDELVVHEPRPVHRFHHASDRLVIDRDAAREAIQAVAVRRRPELSDQLALLGDQTHINPLAGKVKPNMQHALLTSSRHARRQDQPPPPRTVTGGRFFASNGPARAAATARA